MNDRIPTSATSPANQASSSERGIDRLFAEMEAMYGSKMADLWAGTDIERVKEVWVEKLKPFAVHPGVVQGALKALDYHPNPPTLPVFLGLCRDAMRHVDEPAKALPHKLTEEELERARVAAESAVKVVKPIRGEAIDVHWGTHPAGHRHLKAIFEAAEKDRRFRPCVEEMVKNGVCTADGHLLKSYSLGQWHAVHRSAA